MIWEPVGGAPAKCFFRGHVQGVGFRYTVQRLAQNHAVTGFVRNLADGRVEVVTEGLSAELDRFISRIEEAMSDFIRETHQSRLAASGEFVDFTIRH